MGVNVKEAGLMFPIRRITFKLVDGATDADMDELERLLMADGADSDIGATILYFEGQPKIQNMTIYHNDIKVHLSRA